MPHDFRIGEHYNLVVNVFGKRGSGKTYLSRKIADEFKRKIVYDTRNRIGTPGISGKFDTEFDTNAKACFNLDHLIKDLSSFIKEDEFTLVYKPKILSEEDFADFCEICDTNEVSDVLVYIEEIGVLTSTHHFSGIPDTFANLLRTGRHHNIHLLLNAQRPSDVNRLITAESSHIIVFKQTEPKDLQYFAGYFGEHTEKIKDLPEYSFLCYSDRDNEIKMYDKNQRQKNLN